MALERDEPSIPSFACPHCGGHVPATTVVIHKGDGHQSGPNAKAKIDKRTQIFGFRIFPRNDNGFHSLLFIAVVVAGISLWQLSVNLLDAGNRLIGTHDAGEVGRILFGASLVCGPLLLLSITSHLVVVFGIYSAVLKGAETIARFIVESDRASRNRAHSFANRLREELLSDEMMPNEAKSEQEDRMARIAVLRCRLEDERNRHGAMGRFLRSTWVSFFADEDVIALRDAKVSDDEDDDGGWS